MNGVKYKVVFPDLFVIGSLSGVRVVAVYCLSIPKFGPSLLGVCSATLIKRSDPI